MHCKASSDRTNTSRDKCTECRVKWAGKDVLAVPIPTSSLLPEARSTVVEVAARLEDPRMTLVARRLLFEIEMQMKGLMVEERRDSGKKVVGGKEQVGEKDEEVGVWKEFDEWIAAEGGEWC